MAICDCQPLFTQPAVCIVGLVAVVIAYRWCVGVLDKMPCWFFGKNELHNTPSFRNGIDAPAEEKYRREGAKLIIDAGSALGLYPFYYI